MITKDAARRRCAALMVNFGVRGFSVRVGRIAGAWALCDYTKKEIVINPATLRCDWVFLNQILVHEVAHAALPAAAGHSKLWRDTAAAMGYRLGVRVAYTDRIVGQHEWALTCRTGEHSAIRYEKTFADDEKICGKCIDSGAGEVPVFWERL